MSSDSFYLSLNKINYLLNNSTILEWHSQIVDLFWILIYNSIMKTAKDINKMKLFPRDTLWRIIPWLKEREAIVITGARRVGKTFLLYLIAQEIGKDVYFFDLEDPEDYEIVSSGPDAVAHFVKSGYVFIDEIQYLGSFSKFIKLAVDHYPQIKLLCSGSSALSIAKGYSDALVGRVVEFELLPLSFREFLYFKVKEQYLSLFADKNLKVFKPTGALNKMFEEFLLYGGYPEVALLDSTEKKITYIANIFRIYGKRDIKSFFEINKEIAFERFFHTLSDSIGSILSISKISSDLGISPKTLERYLTILSNLYLIKLLPPLSRNIRTEIKKAKKPYFIDTGLLNWAKGSFLDVSKRGDIGEITENLSYLSIKRKLKNDGRLLFWRKKSGAEVDFIISNRTIIPIESKWSRNVKLGKGFYSFINQYHPKKAIILTKDTFRKEKLKDGIEIHFIPLMLFDTLVESEISALYLDEE